MSLTCFLTGAAHNFRLSTVRVNECERNVRSRVTDLAPNFPTKKRPTASGESGLTRASNRSFMGMSSGGGLEHRIRNSFAALPDGDGPFCAVLFSLKILARRSITSRSVSCSATALGSKMVARRSVFVR